MLPKILNFAFLGILITFFTEIARINATSEFLSSIGAEKVPYIYILCSIVSPGASLALNQMYLWTGKYYQVLLLYFVVLLGTFGCLHYFDLDQRSHPVLWAYFAISQVNAILAPLLLSNLLARYFNAFDAKKYFPLFNSTDEIGAILAYVLIGQFLYDRSIKDFFLFGTIAISAVLLALLPLIWRKSVKYGSAAEDRRRAKSSVQLLKGRLFLLIILSAAIFQIIGVSISYEFNSVIEERFKDPAGLNRFLANFEMIVSFSIIGCSVLFGRFVFPYLQMVVLQVACATIMLLATTGLIAFPVMAMYLVSEFVRNLLDNTLYSASFTQITNAFSTRISLALKTVTQGFAIPLVTVISGFILLLFPSEEGFPVLNTLMAAMGLVWLYLSIQMRKEHLKYHSDSLSSEYQEVVIRSVQALGEYKNYPAVAALIQVLETSKSHTVQKYSILSLGNIRATEVLKVLFRQIYSGNEEIQNTTVQSISSYDSFVAQRFLIDFLSGKYCKSLLVREGLIRILHRLMGSALIPILLPFLDNADPRIIANTIESMSETKDRRIVEILRPFLRHENNRIRANAILVLYKFRDVRRECEAALSEFLASQTPNHVLSFVYVVGRLRLRKYLPRIRGLAPTDDKTLRINLAFALCGFGLKEGIQSFTDIFSSDDEPLIRQALHHFLQLSPGVRLRIIGNYLEQEKSHQRAMAMMTILRSSHFDFYEEFEILEDGLQKMTISNGAPAPEPAG